MRVSATYRCDNCGLEEFVEGSKGPKGWGTSKWTEPFITRPPGYYKVEPQRPPNGTITHVCSANCNRALQVKFLGEVVVDELARGEKQS